MDFERGAGVRTGAPWAGITATTAGVAALMSQFLCCVPGVNVVAWLVSAGLTGVCLLAAAVGMKQGRRGGTTHALSVVGLVLGVFNALILLVWLALQLGLVSFLGFVIWDEQANGHI